MTAAFQALLSMGFFQGKNTGSGLPSSPQVLSPIQGSNPRLLHWQADSFTITSGKLVPVPAYFSTWEPSFGVQGTSMIRTLVTRARRAELPGDASVFSDFELGGGERARGGGKSGVAREMQLAFKNPLFSVILPLASLKPRLPRYLLPGSRECLEKMCGRPR